MARLLPSSGRECIIPPVRLKRTHHRMLPRRSAIRVPGIITRPRASSQGQGFARRAEVACFDADEWHEDNTADREFADRDLREFVSGELHTLPLRVSVAAQGFVVPKGKKQGAGVKKKKQPRVTAGAT